MNRRYTIGVVGNPNCGKTTLFNALTGSKQRVGNWPGVTVERKTGHYRFQGVDFTLVDLPGTYSLDVTGDEVSLDERIARDFVHAREADLILNILDAANLERNLYLSAQLIEMGRPLVLALNMMDSARERGIRIDVAGIAERIGCPTVGISASSGEGVERLRQVLLEAVESKPISQARIDYDPGIERAIEALLPRVEPIARIAGDSPRWLAARLLEGDDLARGLVGDRVSRTEIESLLGDQADDLDIFLADARYGFAHRLVRATAVQTGQASRTLTDSVDRVVLHRGLGIPIFLLAMYLMFMLTINIGGAFVDFFDQAGETLFVGGIRALLAFAGAPEWTKAILADGVGAGLQVVGTFIPIIGLLYICLSILEDSGYMARAAFVMDRFMRAIGLPGKSFVPLLVGFGCNVPAIMATRTLESERDRIMTVLMAPFMSCGARLPVYALFAAAFFPTNGQNVIFGLYLIGILAAVLTGLIMKGTLLKGESTPFVMELPPYRLPTVKGVLLRTWERTKGFVLGAGRIIVPMVVVIHLLGGIGTDLSFGNKDPDRSLLSQVGRALSPLFAPMGLHADNWPATVGILTGILAKEAVVGTLDATYSALGDTDKGAATKEESAPAPYSLTGGLAAALATIPVNLAHAVASWSDPLGLSDPTANDKVRAVSGGTFGAMAARFDGTAGAFAYLLFILLYAPCVAATSAIYREIGPRWMLFALGWTTGLGYLMATLFYQASSLGRDPTGSSAWILALAVVFAGSLFALRRAAQRASVAPALAPGAAWARQSGGRP